MRDNPAVPVKQLSRIGESDKTASTGAPVIPPVERLLALDTLTLWRVVLAMLGGWTWRTMIFAGGGEGWELVDPKMQSMGVRLCPNGAVLPYETPDPLSDPAAAWELMMREACGWSPDGGGWHSFNYATQDDTHARGPWHKVPNRALGLAVLHKHAALHLRPLITPLLERINKEGLDK